MQGMTKFLAGIAIVIGVVFLGVAVAAVPGAFAEPGPHVDLTTMFAVVAAVAGLLGLLFLGLGWAILTKRDER
jgi:hypothetical protein